MQNFQSNTQSNLLSYSNNSNSWLNANFFEEKNSKNEFYSSQLMKLFEEELKGIFWGEKSLIKAMPRMISIATSEELIDALSKHLEQTYTQVERIAQVFASIAKKPMTKKCESMENLIKEASEVMLGCEMGPMCDAGIIAAIQKVEHNKIASYGTLRQFAQTLSLDEAVKLLSVTLKDEKVKDEQLSKIACNAINLQAAEIVA